MNFVKIDFILIRLFKILMPVFSFDIFARLNDGNMTDFLIAM